MFGEMRMLQCYSENAAESQGNSREFLLSGLLPELEDSHQADKPHKTGDPAHARPCASSARGLAKVAYRMLREDESEGKGVRCYTR